VQPVKLTGRLVGLWELEGSDLPALHAVYGDPAVGEYIGRQVGGYARAGRCNLSAPAEVCH